MRSGFRGAERQHYIKKLNRRDGERWKPIIFDREGNEIEEQEHFSPSRYRLMAVKVLGYTHTEAGLRRLGEIADECAEYNDMMAESCRNDDDIVYN